MRTLDPLAPKPTNPALSAGLRASLCITTSLRLRRKVGRRGLSIPVLLLSFLWSQGVWDLGFTRGSVVRQYRLKGFVMRILFGAMVLNMIPHLDYRRRIQIVYGYRFVVRGFGQPNMSHVRVAGSDFWRLWPIGFSIVSKMTES